MVFVYLILAAIGPRLGDALGGLFRDLGIVGGDVGLPIELRAGILIVGVLADPVPADEAQLDGPAEHGAGLVRPLRVDELFINHLGGDRGLVVDDEGDDFVDDDFIVLVGAGALGRLGERVAPLGEHVLHVLRGDTVGGGDERDGLVAGGDGGDDVLARELGHLVSFLLAFLSL